MNTTAWLLYDLAYNPTMQDRLYQEISYYTNDNQVDLDFENVNRMPFLNGLIKETLRLHNPAGRLNRLCTERCKLDNTDFYIEKGTWVDICLDVVHHHESNYKNPKIFDPERFMAGTYDKLSKSTFLSFGEGPRICVGKKFALIEIKLTIAMLMRKFIFEPWTVGSEDPVIINNIKLNMVDNIYVKLIKRPETY